MKKRYLAKHMDKALEVQREISSGPFARIGEFFGKFCYIIFGKRQGNYLLVVYLFTKLLFIGNVVCQLFLLNKFLGNKYNLYGLELLMNILNANLNVPGSGLHPNGVGGAIHTGMHGIGGGGPGLLSGGAGSINGLGGSGLNLGGSGINMSPSQAYTEVVESPRFPRVTMCHFQVFFNKNLKYLHF